MRDAHPDAPRGSTARALATRAAYEAATRALTDGTLADAATRRRRRRVRGEDARERVRRRATRVRRTAPRCRGRGGVRVELRRRRRRGRSSTDATTGKARWIERDDFADASADDVVGAGVRRVVRERACPEKCIAFVTRRQREFMLEVLENDDGASGVDAFLRELVETAEYVNGREAGRRRARGRRDE